LSVEIRLEDIGHEYEGQAPLFRGVSWRFSRGTTTAIVGPSGTGKSTLLNMLAGWLLPVHGRIVRVGIERTQWVFQNPHGVARRSALDHVTLPLIAQGKRRFEAESEADELLRQTGLEGVRNRQFRELSGGEAQRLMLARAIACSPDLLDEPTAQLDRVTARLVNQAISRTASRNCIVAIATHDPATRDACGSVLDLGVFIA
jgi:lipoprotein-releasing system ATP-binding protein